MLKALPLLAAALFWTSSALASRLPYSVKWQELAESRLDPQEVERALFIMEGAEWHEWNSDGDRDPGLEPRRGNLKSSDELHFVVDEAKKGDKSAFDVLMFLLDSSRPQKELKYFHRGHAKYGTMVLAPGSGRNSTNLVLKYLAHEVKKNPRRFEALIKSLIRKSLTEPNNIARIEAVTSLMSHPALGDQLARVKEARDFLLLQTAHPVPSVRMMAHIALAPFVFKDADVRRFLLETSSHKPEGIFSAAEYQYVEDILDFVESQKRLPAGELAAWREIFMAKVQNWREQKLRSQIKDMGDFNTERMANGSAAQAFLVAAHSPSLEEGREVILHFDRGMKQVTEKFRLIERLPVIRGLDAGNGTGFGAYGAVEFEGILHRKDVISQTILVEARPNNMWALMALPHPQLTQLFDRLAVEPLQIHFGHLTSVMGRLKYGVLKLPPPEYFHSELDTFEKKLARHYRLEVKELRNMPETFVAKNIGDFSSYLLRLGSRLADPELLRVKALSRPLTDSVFVRSLSELYALRALALMGDTELVREKLLEKLPKSWDLDEQAQRDLGKSMSNYRLNSDRSGILRTADLTDKGKIKSLQLLFESFNYAWPEADARHEIVHWMSGLKDQKLIEATQGYLKASCAEALK